MAERDPFGRLPDENPLAGLGSLSDGIESQHAAQPVVSGRHSADAVDERWRGGSDAQAPDERWRGGTDAAAGSAPPPKRPRTPAAGSRQAALRDLLGVVEQMKAAGTRAGGAAGMPAPQVVNIVGRAVKTVVFLAIVIAIATVGATMVSTSKSVKDQISKLPSQFGGEPLPVGLAKGSLLVRRNLAPALRRLRTSGLGQLKSLSIRPERIDAQLLTKDGRLRSVQQRFDGKLSELSISASGFAQLPTIPFARANSAAPSRLARSAAGRVKRPLSQVDYVVLIGRDPSAAWTVVMKKGGGQFIGDARGRITRRIG